MCIYLLAHTDEDDGTGTNCIHMVVWVVAFCFTQNRSLKDGYYRIAGVH
jgi:hypothetical protein